MKGPERPDACGRECMPLADTHCQCKWRVHRLLLSMFLRIYAASVALFQASEPPLDDRREQLQTSGQRL